MLTQGTSERYAFSGAILEESDRTSREETLHDSIGDGAQVEGCGLAWKPVHGDRFVAPDRSMDDLVFVINDMATIIEMWQGAPAVTFTARPSGLSIPSISVRQSGSRTKPVARAVAVRSGADRFGYV